MAFSARRFDSGCATRTLWSLRELRREGGGDHVASKSLGRPSADAAPPARTVHDAAPRPAGGPAEGTTRPCRADAERRSRTASAWRATERRSAGLLAALPRDRPLPRL